MQIVHNLNKINKVYMCVCRYSDQEININAITDSARNSKTYKGFSLKTAKINRVHRVRFYNDFYTQIFLI